MADRICLYHLRTWKLKSIKVYHRRIIFETIILSMTKYYMKRLLGYLSLAFLGACSPDKQSDTSTWPTFGHDFSNNKFSTLTDINTTNVARLKEVWRFEDTTEGGGIYFNPVMMDKRLIGLMPSSKLVALD